MYVDPTSLAHTVGTALSPFLPYLLTATDKAMEEGAKAFGAEAWTWAVELWNKLRHGAGDDPAALRAVRSLSDSGVERDALAVFERYLQALFIANQRLAAEISGTLERRPNHIRLDTTVTALGERSVAIGGNANRARIETGDSNVSRPTLLDDQP